MKQSTKLVARLAAAVLVGGVAIAPARAQPVISEATDKWATTTCPVVNAGQDFYEDLALREARKRIRANPKLADHREALIDEIAQNLLIIACREGNKRNTGQLVPGRRPAQSLLGNS